MRAPFDRLVDVYWGVSVFPTLTLRAANVPARWVTNDAFLQFGDPFFNIEGYLTADAISFTPPELVNAVGSEITLDFGAADLIALTPGGPITHQVYLEELRSWNTGADYRRAHLGTPIGDLPSACAAGYAEEYRYGFNGPGFDILTRTSPTTWTDGIYTLTAEVSGPPNSLCRSTWRFTGFGDEWETTYDGGVPGIPGLFALTVPPGTPAVWIYRV